MTELDEAVVERVAETIRNSYTNYDWTNAKEPPSEVYARAAIRLLASEGRLCEPGTVGVLKECVPYVCVVADTSDENKDVAKEAHAIVMRARAVLPGG